MKKITLNIVINIIFISSSFAQSALTGTINYTTFTRQPAGITKELETLTDKSFRNHPEYGILPVNAPCRDCFELLQKRDANHRYFVKNGSNGKEFYQQTSYSDVNYKENGVLHSIDPRLVPSDKEGVYKAMHQPFPVTLNASEKFASILNDGKELQVNRNVHIFIQHTDGSVTSFGEPDWTHYTAGDDGIMIHDFYPGIDLELRQESGTWKVSIE